MFGKVIWDKLSKCVFENFEIAPVEWEQFQNYKNQAGGLSQKLPQPNMWLLVNYTKPTIHFVLIYLIFNN